MQVLKINEEVYLQVSDRFSELCLMLLPSLNITLAKTRESASQGLSVSVRSNLGAGDSTSMASLEGSFGLEQLSGGQRSLVSLALLVAAAQEGSHSSVILLDEVDAALDEVNQALVARLLRVFSHSHGAQVICVSHNKAFQQICDAIINIARDGDSGGSVVCAQKAEKRYDCMSLE